jgi:hypothetical protein
MNDDLSGVDDRPFVDGHPVDLAQPARGSGKKDVPAEGGASAPAVENKAPVEEEEDASKKEKNAKQPAGILKTTNKQKADTRSETKKPDSKHQSKPATETTSSSPVPSAAALQVKQTTGDTLSRLVDVKPKTMDAQPPTYVNPASLIPVTDPPKKPQWVFERPHFSKPASPGQRRLAVPPLYTLLPCFSNWRPAPAPLPMMMQQYQVQPPQQDSKRKSPSIASDTTIAVPAPPKAEAPKVEESKAEPSPRSPVVINIYTTSDKPMIESQESPAESSRSKVKIVKKSTVIDADVSEEEDAAEEPITKRITKKVTVKKVLRDDASQSTAEEEPADGAKAKKGRKAGGGKAMSNVKSVKKTTVINVQETDEEEGADEAPQPVKRVTKKTQVRKVVVGKGDGDEAEAPPESKANPPKARVKTAKKRTVINVQESDEEQEEVEEVTEPPSKRVTKKTKVKNVVDSENPASASTQGSKTKDKIMKAWSLSSSSSSSAVASALLGDRMVGKGRFVGGKIITEIKAADSKDTKKDDAKDDDHASSISSSQRSLKPTGKPQAPPAQNVWQGGPGFFPPPGFGGFAPQTWQMFPPQTPMVPPPSNDKKKPPSKTSSRTTSKHSSKKNDDDKPTSVPAVEIWDFPAPASLDPSKKAPSAKLPTERLPSAPPSDIAIHLPPNWRGKVVFKDQSSPKSGSGTRKQRERATPTHDRPQSSSRTADLNNVYTTPQRVRVHVNVHRDRDEARYPPRPTASTNPSPSDPSPRSNQAAPSSYRPPSAGPPSPPFEIPTRATPRTSPQHPQRVWRHPEHTDIWEVFSVSTRDEFDPGARDVHPHDSASNIGARYHHDDNEERRRYERRHMRQIMGIESEVGRAETILTSVEDDVELKHDDQLAEDRGQARSHTSHNPSRQPSRAPSRVSRTSQRSHHSSHAARSPSRSHHSHAASGTSLRGHHAIHAEGARSESRRYREHVSDESLVSGGGRRRKYRRPEYLSAQEEEVVQEKNEGGVQW